jgi:hypothetical protein
MRKFLIASMLFLSLNACAPALIAGSIGGAILAVPATSYLMEPPDTKIEMAASGSGASPDYAIVRAFNALRPTLGSKKNTLIVGHVLKEMGNVKPVAGVVIKKVVDYKKDTMSITIKLAENSVSTYDATIHYYVRE